MGNRISRSWTLVKESYRVLKSTPGLAFFPVVSSIACFVAIVSFFLPLILTGAVQHLNNGLTATHYVVLFAFYFVTSFIVIFFNSALVSCAFASLKGQPTTCRDGLRNASRHLGPILLWSLISATIGMILRAVNERAGVVGRIITALLGAAWSLVTYFVVPVMVIEGTQPVPAVKRSWSILKATWGEKIIGSGAMGFVFFGFTLLGLIPVGIGIAIAANGALFFSIPFFVIAVLYWIVLSIVSATLNGIFNTALYVYASSGQVPIGFSEDYVRGAFVEKQGKDIFKSNYFRG